MFTLITKCEVQLPPQAVNLRIPEDVERADARRFFQTYGGVLDNDEFAVVEPELRTLVKRCLAHVPVQRPSLRELEQRVSEKVLRNQFLRESDTAVREWVLRNVYSAPVTASPDGSGGTSSSK